jgi:riboflavin kinase/FMN adenylyltransferase
VKIHHSVEARTSDRPLVLAIGFFDGFHRGHREIVRALLRARRPGYRAAVLSFRNHPATHLRPGAVPALITTAEERVNLLADAGIDELYLVPFDANLAELEARRFLEEFVLERLGARALVVGSNFRFGARRTGDAALAAEVMHAHGAEAQAVPPLLDDGERISSTRVRAAIARGDFATADRLLCAPYCLRGRVALGHGRGHDLGFPTANLQTPPGKLIPKDGVYTVVGRYDGRDYRGLVSIGDNPTFGPGAKTVEAWLQDFRKTIYGEELALRDFAFVRDQRAFGSSEELVEQMLQDATHVQFPAFTLS